ncbi:diacylglycerol/lipid kinase family protein [Arsenicicoccus sp. oral taxon 190]|uniref:diacylglycerol/lipid kinase family protein n=1 Tax=Arsenicicoccus sp. oral taxon 190 TaxID=1658671 RepID=UPI000B0B2F97|nr:diacylglycerol kinase family protein [Arsenicicoccus sp. oral taxon 190]
MWVWILVAVVVLLLVVAVVAGRGRQRADATEPEPESPAPESRPEPAAEPRRPRAAVVVNPTKFDDVEQVRAEITEVCAELGWDEPLWFETTEDDPGSGQTKEAMAAGVDVICPLGGDGTVRAVGSELTEARSTIPLGLLPGGTGNLLARNLDLPIASLRDALLIALTGDDRPVDVGLLTVTPVPVDGEPEVDDAPIDADALAPQDRGPGKIHFLVMAGMGFDADVMADAPEKLKSAMGWPAYLVSGVKHLWGPQFKAHVTTDDEDFTRRTRSVLIGNVGRIQGLTLMPEAEIDDGHLDALVLSPTGGVGWGAVALRLATAQRKGHHRVTHHTTRRVTVAADRHVQVQVDGDTIGERTRIEATVLPSALRVRVDPNRPAPSGASAAR